jgi:hypothetical protein
MKPHIPLIVLLLAGPAAAQETPWTYSASLYGWLPGVDTSTDTALGTVDSSLSGSDALSDLEMAFMGTFEARRGRWGLIGDLIYADLSTGEDTPFGLAFSRAEVTTTLTAFSGYAAYRVYDTPQVAIDVAGGFRWFDLDLDTSLKAGALPQQDFSSSDSWANPVIAVRAIVPFGDRWFGTAFADAGGFTGDSSTWQAFASVGYRFDPRWSAQFGYRYMNVETELDGQDTTVELQGPLLGVTARF